MSKRDVVAEFEDWVCCWYDSVVPCDLEIVWHGRIIVRIRDGKPIGYRTQLKLPLLWLLLLLLQLSVVEWCCWRRHHLLGRILWYLLLRSEEASHRRDPRVGPGNWVNEERVVYVPLRLRLLEVLLRQRSWRRIQWPTNHRHRTRRSWWLCLADIEEVSNQTSILVLLSVLLCLKSLLRQT